jgi:hypothetical protein
MTNEQMLTIPRYGLCPILILLVVKYVPVCKYLVGRPTKNDADTTMLCHIVETG